MDTLLQQLVNGLGIGSRIALWAIGYGLVYQVIGLFHFAHGDTIVFSAFVCYGLMTIGVPPAIAAIAAIVVGALLAVAIERAVYRPLIVRGQMFLGLVGALAVAMVLRNVATLVWGFDTKIIDLALVPQFTLKLAGTRIPGTTIINFVCALVVVAAAEYYLRKTRQGQAIEAVAADRYTAALMGIPIGRTIGFVYAVSSAVGVIGLLLFLSETRTLTVSLGFAITVKAFIASLLGGIGSIRGALLGGLLLGFAEAMIGGYVSSLWMDAILFSLLAILLVVRPRGLLGRR
jgi:branched-chain amino acid transport system permease protein